LALSFILSYLTLIPDPMVNPAYSGTLPTELLGIIGISLDNQERALCQG
jgi:hypothetical protein